MATSQFNFRAYIEGVDDLYVVAKALGYVQTRGGRGRGGKGAGSPKQMMEAVARGDAAIIRMDILTPEQRAAVNAVERSQVAALPNGVE